MGNRSLAKDLVTPETFFARWVLQQNANTPEDFTSEIFSKANQKLLYQKKNNTKDALQYHTAGRQPARHCQSVRPRDTHSGEEICAYVLPTYFWSENPSKTRETRGLNDTTRNASDFFPPTISFRPLKCLLQNSCRHQLQASLYQIKRVALAKHARLIPGRKSPASLEKVENVETNQTPSKPRGFWGTTGFCGSPPSVLNTKHLLEVHRSYAPKSKVVNKASPGQLWNSETGKKNRRKKQQNRFFFLQFFLHFFSWIGNVCWKLFPSSTNLGAENPKEKNRIHHLFYLQSEQEKTRSLIWLFAMFFFGWVEVVEERDFLFWIWKFHTLVKHGEVVYCIPKHGSLVPPLLDLLICVKPHTHRRITQFSSGGSK